MRLVTNRTAHVATAALLSLLLSACSSSGGGSNSGSTSGTTDTGGTDGTTAATTDAGNTTGNDTGGSTSAGDTGGETGVGLDAPITWTLGPATYGASSTPRGAQINAFVRIITTFSTTTPDVSNGPYADSDLVIHMSPTGAGDYTVVDNTNRVSDANGAKVAFIIASADAADENGVARTTWISTTGLISVKVDSEGRYHASTVEPLTLTRQDDQGTGVPDSPDQINFTMQNIFGSELDG